MIDLTVIERKVTRTEKEYKFTFEDEIFLSARDFQHSDCISVQIKALHDVPFTSYVIITVNNDYITVSTARSLDPLFINQDYNNWKEITKEQFLNRVKNKIGLIRYSALKELMED